MLMSAYALPRNPILLEHTQVAAHVHNFSAQSATFLGRSIRRLVVVLERRVYVHALESLELLETLDTAPNAKGVCALTVCSEPCLLALPLSAAGGQLRIHDLLAGGGGGVLSELAAHKLNVVRSKAQGCQAFMGRWSGISN